MPRRSDLPKHADNNWIFASHFSKWWLESEGSTNVPREPYESHGEEDTLIDGTPSWQGDIAPLKKSLRTMMNEWPVDELPEISYWPSAEAIREKRASDFANCGHHDSYEDYEITYYVTTDAYGKEKRWRIE